MHELPEVCPCEQISQLGDRSRFSTRHFIATNSRKHDTMSFRSKVCSEDVRGRMVFPDVTGECDKTFNRTERQRARTCQIDMQAGTAALLSA